MKLSGMMAVIIVWAAFGALLNAYQVTTHPAYWAIYGGAFGFVVGTFRKRKTTVSRFRGEIFLNR